MDKTASWDDDELESHSGVYIMENTSPPGGEGKYQPMSFGGKNMKQGREKEGKM
jgi:hypothetical protein